MTMPRPPRQSSRAPLEAQELTGSSDTKGSESALKAILLVAVILPLCVLAVLIGDTIIKGWERLDLSLLFDSQGITAAESGLYHAIVGSMWLMALTALIAVPLGIGAAIYLEEYAPKNGLTRLIEVNITNLAGVPSIVYGLLGLAVFVRFSGLGPSVLAGALTLSLLILPVIITASREALRSVPPSLREASYALGADRFATIRRVVLPMSLPSILTGVILAVSRAVGETAPIIVVGAAALTTRPAAGPLDRYEALPVSIYSMTSSTSEWHTLAAAGIVVLLAFLLSLNALAIYLRNRFQRRAEY